MTLSFQEHSLPASRAKTEEGNGTDFGEQTTNTA
jgi:hypothetical protein